jgi:hypothetical protein
MSRTATRALAMTLGLLASGSAWALWWDWDEEFTSRHWRTNTLTWAQDIRSDHPTLVYIQANYSPPAHEMWCHHAQAPAAIDCATFHNKLDAWLQVYLNTQNVPQAAFDAFPKECASNCTP